MSRPASDEKSRFLSFVDVSPNGCHEWRSTLSNIGYGKFYFRGKQQMAHRAAYTLFGGDIPKGKWVLHKCDNRKCVNLSHLYLGTAKDNTRDKLERCQWHGNMQIDAETIAQCQKKYLEGKTQMTIAKEMGLSQASVSRFVRGSYFSRKEKCYG